RFEIQQRDRSGEQQSNTRKQNNGLQTAIAGVHKKWSKTPEEQRRRRNADRHAQPGQHPTQPELGEHEASAEPEHRREGEKNRCRDGCCPAQESRSTIEDRWPCDFGPCGSSEL